MAELRLLPLDLETEREGDQHVGEHVHHAQRERHAAGRYSPLPICSGRHWKPRRLRDSSLRGPRLQGGLETCERFAKYLSTAFSWVVFSLSVRGFDCSSHSTPPTCPRPALRAISPEVGEEGSSGRRCGRIWLQHVAEIARLNAMDCRARELQEVEPTLGLFRRLRPPDLHPRRLRPWFRMVRCRVLSKAHPVQGRVQYQPGSRF